MVRIGVSVLKRKCSPRIAVVLFVILNVKDAFRLRGSVNSAEKHNETVTFSPSSGSVTKLFETFKTTPLSV